MIRTSLVFTVLLCAADAAAQTTQLSLDEAVALAIEHNRSLQSAEIDAQKAEKDLVSARAQRFPRFRLEAQASELLRPIDIFFPEGAFGTFPTIGPVPSAETRIRTAQQLTMLVNGEVAQPLSQLFRINLGVRMSEASRDLRREQVRASRLAIVNTVKRQYYAILQTESAITAAAHTIKLLREVNRTVDERLLRQVVLKSDALDVVTRLADVEHTHLRLRNTLASQKEQLNQLIGRDVRTPFDIASEPPPAATESDAAAAASQALAARPEVVQARLRVQQAELARRIARSDYVPDISVAVSYLSPLNVDGAPRQIATAGLQMQWEPFDWGRRGRNVAAKDLEIRQARNTLRDAEDQVVLQVNAAHRRLEESRSLLRVAGLSRDAARETARVRASQFQVQAVLLSDVLHAQSGLADADNRYQQALFALGQASADYELALGQDVKQ